MSLFRFQFFIELFLFGAVDCCEFFQKDGCGRGIRRDFEIGNWREQISRLLLG